MTDIPTLHDWYLCSIEIDDETVKIGFREPEGTEKKLLLAEGVNRLACDNLRQGNIVLSVDTGVEHASDASLRRLLHLAPTEDDPSMERLREQIQSGTLQFVQIMPSYGASIVLTAKSTVMI